MSKFNATFVRRIRCSAKQCNKERDVWDFATQARMEMQCTEI